MDTVTIMGTKESPLTFTASNGTLVACRGLRLDLKTLRPIWMASK
jgi:hypothetical protein